MNVSLALTLFIHTVVFHGLILYIYLQLHIVEVPLSVSFMLRVWVRGAVVSHSKFTGDPASQSPSTIYNIPRDCGTVVAGEAKKEISIFKFRLKMLCSS